MRDSTGRGGGQCPIPNTINMSHEMAPNRALGQKWDEYSASWSWQRSWAQELLDRLTAKPSGALRLSTSHYLQSLTSKGLFLWVTFFPRKLYVTHCVKGKLILFFVGNKIKTHNSSWTIEPLKLYVYISFFLKRYDSAFKFTKSSTTSKKGETLNCACTLIFSIPWFWTWPRKVGKGRCLWMTPLCEALYKNYLISFLP